ncbi:hypothetical protein B0H10DRAFT_2191032 [Mycena sp. CBHHK59/15]|nr:hypothetical protein B0H10DRAFT_2191032 [Mycena sp. CBHHK59/15]
MDAPAELVCSTDFWFDDGTVVLQVENTLYRVYRGLLSSRSTVFRDTFSIPQPVEERVEIEGCPVVQLHDKARDFTCFLKALHHYGSYKNCPVSGFAELESVLRLSDKYDVPLLRDSMTSILSDLYPSSLDKWADRKHHPGYTAFIRDNFSALNIAVKMNIRSILPAVMYEVCCRSTLESIVSGMGQAKLKIENNEYRKRCILAIPRLMLAQRQALGYLKREYDDDCKHRAVCNTERLRWFALDLEDDEAFDPLDDNNLDSWDVFRVCSSCLETAKKTYANARQDLWNKLPSIFNLGTWDDLLA